MKKLNRFVKIFWDAFHKTKSSMTIIEAEFIVKIGQQIETGDVYIGKYDNICKITTKQLLEKGISKVWKKSIEYTNINKTVTKILKQEYNTTKGEKVLRAAMEKIRNKRLI